MHTFVPGIFTPLIWIELLKVRNGNKQRLIACYRLSAISVGQKLLQAGFVLGLLGMLFVLRTLHWRRRAQHCARCSFYGAGSRELL